MDYELMDYELMERTNTTTTTTPPPPLPPLLCRGVVEPRIRGDNRRFCGRIIGWLSICGPSSLRVEIREDANPIPGTQRKRSENCQRRVPQGSLKRWEQRAPAPQLDDVSIGLHPGSALRLPL